MDAQNNFTKYEKERTGDFLGYYKNSLQRAKEIFEGCLDIGQDDPWFMERWDQINRESAKFENLEKQASAEQAAKEAALNRKQFAYSERSMNKTILPISKALKEIKFPIELEIHGEKYSTTNCWEADIL